MVDPPFLIATYPLFEDGVVDVVEWSFDIAWDASPIVGWASELLKHYSARKRLIGHGVTLSILTVDADNHHERWFTRFADEVGKLDYRHISEHFGFMLAGVFHQGAPLPVFADETLLDLTRERMRRLQHIAGVPIGLENLAFAFGPHEIERQARFIGDILKSVDGFLVLDLHNLFCQAKNFERDVTELIALYDLSRVKEIHISGGSWSESGDPMDARPVRRDTHDARVPEEILRVLPQALKMCPNVEAVIFERLGDTLTNEHEISHFQEDYHRIRSIVAGVSQ
jgi:uncharacterized protein (UPF0276 family)